MDEHAILCILIGLWVTNLILCTILYVGTKEVPMSDVTDLKAEVLLLRRENSELRKRNHQLCELCEEQLDNLMPEICAKSWWCEGKDWHTCNDDACGNYTFVILARELGVTA